MENSSLKTEKKIKYNALWFEVEIPDNIAPERYQSIVQWHRNIAKFWPTAIIAATLLFVCSLCEHNIGFQLFRLLFSLTMTFLFVPLYYAFQLLRLVREVGKELSELEHDIEFQ